MNILSLDPSLRATGYSIIKEESGIPGELIHCGCIQTKKILGSKQSASDIIALEVLSMELKKLIEDYKIDLILFEESFGSKSSRAVQSLAYSKAITVCVATIFGIKAIPTKAREIKKTLTGNLNAEKSEILDVVIKNFPNFTEITKGCNKTIIYAASDSIAVYLKYKN